MSLFKKFSLLSYFSFLVYSMAYTQLPAFPGAEGFGSFATGGRGGKVIYVTNLNTEGEGSLQAALNESGKRYILFKVSGVINGTVEVPPGHGDFTIAGQTSTNGIIIRGFQSYNGEDRSSGNFIVRHLRSRIGDTDTYPSSAWLGADGLTLGGVHNAIIDHCSFGQANDEAVDISRSSGLTIQNCILSETLGGHSYLGGMLINYSSAQSRLDSLSIHHNIWNRMGGRMPEISCETSYCNGKTLNIEVSNNVFYDPRIEMWYEGVTGSGNFYLNMNAVNNYSFATNNFNNAIFHHDLLHFNQNKLFFSGNKLSRYPQYSDYQLFYCCNDFDTNHPNTDFRSAERRNQRHNFPLIGYTDVSSILDYMVDNVGAYPRDVMDTRLMARVEDRSFDAQSIDVDHYQDAFSIETSSNIVVDTDNDGMPDYWENKMGLNNNVQDHNGSALSATIYGVAGYTNLEVYLHCLSDALISGPSLPCGIEFSPITATNEIKNNDTIYPNPAMNFFNVEASKIMDEISFFSLDGKALFKQKVQSEQAVIHVENYNGGLYLMKIKFADGSSRVEKVMVVK